MSAADRKPFAITRAQLVATARAAKARAKADCYRIEGEYVSMREIATRLGVHRNVAMSRVARLRNASGAITWDRLRGSP